MQVISTVCLLPEIAIQDTQVSSRVPWEVQVDAMHDRLGSNPSHCMIGPASAFCYR
jgi:hypothetical protein